MSAALLAVEPDALTGLAGGLAALSCLLRDGRLAGRLSLAAHVIADGEAVLRVVGKG